MQVLNSMIEACTAIVPVYDIKLVVSGCFYKVRHGIGVPCGGISAIYKPECLVAAFGGMCFKVQFCILNFSTPLIFQGINDKRYRVRIKFYGIGDGSRAVSVIKSSYRVNTSLEVCKCSIG